MKKFNGFELSTKEILQRSNLKSIFGGFLEGNCTVLCNSGARIENAPNADCSTQEFACHNQGGANSANCTGGPVVACAQQ